MEQRYAKSKVEATEAMGVKYEEACEVVSDLRLGTEDASARCGSARVLR